VAPNRGARAVSGQRLRRSEAVTPAIRPESAEDAQAIFGVHVAAFATDAEARLVQALRASGKVTVSLVAQIEGGVVGHVLFSAVSVDLQPGPARGVGLAPLAVLPAHQRRGIGGRLVEGGLEACCRAGFGFVVVLGDPRYYHRFGFRPARAEGLGSEYGVDEQFMVRELRAGGLADVAGVVRYAPEFSTVEAHPPSCAYRQEPR
jgi:putative acetyltransferase